MKLNKITVKGYKSIQSLENFELRNINVLIGANGAGKSNFISLFRLLAAVGEGNLQGYIKQQGGPDSLLHGGRKKTKSLIAEWYFSPNGYRISLKPTVDNCMVFSREETSFDGDYVPRHVELIGYSNYEANLVNKPTKISEYVLPALKSWKVYHFHDTSETAEVKRSHASNDNLLLKPDAANLGAYIAHLKHNFFDSYQNIIDAVRLAAPFFGDFVVREPLPRDIELEWFELGDPNTPLRAHILSDGTLRFICLTVLLLQPIWKLPDTILIDEPELGLHPYAISLLADMIKRVAEFKQVIVSTQSVELLNHFEPADVIVTERMDGASTFKRLDETELADWLEEYTLGDLWKRNILGGRPSR